MQSPQKQEVPARSNPGIKLGRACRVRLKGGIVERGEINAVRNLDDHPGGRLQTPQRLRCEAANGHNSVSPAERCDGAGSCSGLENPRAAFADVSTMTG